MIDDNDILRRLREKASQTRKQLESEESAILVVEKMLLGFVANPLAPTDCDTTPRSQEVESDSRRSFRDEVRAAVPLFNGENFSAASVHEKLIANGVEVESKERVSMALSKMLKQDEIQSVIKGVGRSPSVYKVKG